MVENTNSAESIRKFIFGRDSHLCKSEEVPDTVEILIPEVSFVNLNFLLHDRQRFLVLVVFFEFSCLSHDNA